MLLRFEAFSSKQRLFFPLGRKNLACKPAQSTLPTVQRRLGDGWSSGHLIAGLGGGFHAAVSASQADVAWPSMAFLYGISLSCASC